MSVELIISFKQGNVKARKEVFELVYKPIFYYALQRTQDEMKSEEIANDSFMKVINKTDYEYTNVNGLLTILFTIARNACKDHRRKTERENKVKNELLYISSKEDKGKNVMEDEEKYARLMDTIHKAIPLQPEKRREILEHMMQFKKAKEIARLMNINISGVYKHRDAFVKSLQEDYGIDLDDLPMFSDF